MVELEVQGLRARGIDFQLEQGGSTVRVPESEIDELRIDFASQGLPEGGHVGFEIFEGNAFTATDFVQRLNFQRGLEGELARRAMAQLDSEFSQQAQGRSPQ